jgi:MFS family permease
MMLRRITVAYAVNELGNWLGAVALAVAVFAHTRSAVATAALFVSVRFLPAVLGTAIVARLELLARRGVLATLYLLQALTTGVLAILVVHLLLVPILVLGAVDGIAALAAKALLRAVVSQRSADDDARRRANGRLNSCWAATAALGPVVAGLLSAAVGPPMVLVLDVVSFVIAAALVLDVSTPRTENGSARIADQLNDVVRHVKANSALGWLLCTEAVAIVFFAAVVPVEVVFVKATLHAGDQGYGALLASWGAGMVLGSVVFTRARRRPLSALLTAGTLAVAVGYLGIAASIVLWVACAFSFIGGTGNGMQWIALVTAVQDQTPASLQGRFMGVVESMGRLCPAIGFALGGAVAAVSQPRVTFVMSGAAAAVATCAFGVLAARNHSRQLPVAASAVTRSG